MSIKVLPIQLSSLEDLTRLIADIRKERSVLISYKESGKYVVGFYLPPQVKNVHGVFVYILADELFHVISYSPNDGGTEVFKTEYTESPLYVNIFVSKLENAPHEFGELEGVNVVKVDVKDIKSLIYLAYSTSFEHLIVPFIWYIEDENTFLINVEVPTSDDGEDNLLIFRYKDSDFEIEKPYLVYDPKEDAISLSDVPKDLSKKYVLVVKVKQFFKI